MALSAQIKKDTREVERLLRGLKNGANRVIVRALNKTAKKTESAGVKIIARDLRVAQKVVRQSVKLSRANFAIKRAVVVASGKRVPIIQLGARQTRRGVSYKGRGGGRALIPGGFIATMPTGYQGAFKRKGGKRLPIQELHGPSVPAIFVRRATERVMDRAAADAWEKNIRHELRYFISRLR